MKRDLNRLIYTSSYDRGLQHLLEMWPDIKKEVPEATLDIYYGWLLFEQFYRDNPASMAWMERMKEFMKQEGVTDHGRIPQNELENEYKTAGIFAYPAHFGEINCISAIKAQAFGAIPVVVNYAALAETVQHGIKVDGDIYDQETKDEYKKQLIALLKDHKRQEEIRKPMMKWTTGKYLWDSIASDWDKEFKETL